ncbi:MAG: (Fe-S)-binding protein, partial [Anaerolineales bacterium]|nr:(Fe-S)-binding protein [Anaerolineales bacterium]
MRKSIQLFITCLPDTFRPSIGKAVLNVFAKIGIEVNFPLEQTCCGQPAFNAGMRRQARKLAIHTIQSFEKSYDPIILPSGSCTAMLRKNYLELFKNDPEWLPRAQRIAQRTYEFTEYLVDKIGVRELGSSYPGPVTYHPSCHLHRSLGIEKQPLLLLSHVKDSTKP